VRVSLRLNTHVALALAERLAGTQALAWIAPRVAPCVPPCNVAAVWPLARHGGRGPPSELARNPLIVSTAA
jgi:malonate transporter and related proteins